MIQIAMYSEILKALEQTGIAVYDGRMPLEDEPYPFIYLGEATVMEGSMKTGRSGQYTQSIHVWHNRFNRRGDLARIMEEIIQQCARILAAGTYGIMLRSHSIRILADTTTKTPLLHGVIELNYSYS